MRAPQESKFPKLIWEFSSKIPLTKPCLLKRRWEKRRSKFSGPLWAFVIEVGEGRAVKRRSSFRDLGDAHLYDAVGRHMVYSGPFQADLPGGGEYQSGDGFKSRTFDRPVGTDPGYDFPSNEKNTSPPDHFPAELPLLSEFQQRVKKNGLNGLKNLTKNARGGKERSFIRTNSSEKYFPNYPRAGRKRASLPFLGREVQYITSNRRSF